MKTVSKNNYKMNPNVNKKKHISLCAQVQNQMDSSTSRSRVKNILDQLKTQNIT